MKDWVTGEEVSYTYDSLSRLAAAVTTGPEWGLSFTYDGFGNKTDQTVTKGSAPSYSGLVDPATNRWVGTSYDANGNTYGNGFGYDVENRLVAANGEQYLYRPDNKRIYRRRPAGGEDYEEFVDFYDVGGRKLATYRWEDGQFQFETTNVYFAGKLIRSGDKPVVLDQLGSVRTHGKERLDYFPYGEEKPRATTQDRYKFGTYYRDTTGLDYADQRYYSSITGRFITPDPYVASRGPMDPGSWNRYAYVENDPVNYRDPKGLFAYLDVDVDFGAGWSGPVDPLILFYNGFAPDTPMPWAAPLPDGGGGVAAPSPIVGRSGLKYYGLYSEGAKYDKVAARIKDLNARLGTDSDCLNWLQAGARGGYAEPSLLATLSETGRVAGRIEKGGNNAPGITATALDVPGISIIVNGEGRLYYDGTSLRSQRR